MTWPVSSVLLAIVLLATAGCTRQAPQAGIDPSDLRQVTRGEAVYREHCAVCHGADREGQPDWRRRLPSGRLPAPPHDESGHTWHHPNADLFAMTKHGMVPPLAPEGYASDMPAYAEVLSDDDIRAVLAWIQSTWSPEIHTVRRRMLEQAGR